jgi:hypothetical protein
MKKSRAPKRVFPTVVIPIIRIPQPDGSLLIRRGNPEIIHGGIGTAEAARLLGMSRNWVITECESGSFRSAHKPGTRPGSQWRISRDEVLARVEKAP